MEDISWGESDNNYARKAMAPYSVDELKAEIERREKDKVDRPIVSYYVYLHSNKDSAYDAAAKAGFSPEEITKYNLVYMGYEERLKITVNRTTGEITQEWRGHQNEQS